MRSLFTKTAAALLAMAVCFPPALPAARAEEPIKLGGDPVVVIIEPDGSNWRVERKWEQVDELDRLLRLARLTPKKGLPRLFAHRSESLRRGAEVSRQNRESYERLARDGRVLFGDCLSAEVQMDMTNGWHRMVMWSLKGGPRTLSRQEVVDHLRLLLAREYALQACWIER